MAEASGLRSPIRVWSSPEPRRVYDVRDALRGIVDGGSMLELCPRWARNVVTTLARIDGRPVGIVANQPHHLARCAGCREFRESGAVRVVLQLVRTPADRGGRHARVHARFQAGAAGVIRHGASLVRAFAAARVPKLTVVLRKSYGGAYITMNSRDLGADLVLAWPDAELGIMSARAAVGVVHRRELRAADDVEARARLADDYAAEHLVAERPRRPGSSTSWSSRPRRASGWRARCGPLRPRDSSRDR